MVSHVPLFAILWTVVLRALLSLGFFRQEYWSGLSFPSPGTEPASPALQAYSLLLSPQGSLYCFHCNVFLWDFFKGVFPIGSFMIPTGGLMICKSFKYSKIFPLSSVLYIFLVYCAAVAVCLPRTIPSALGFQLSEARLSSHCP